VSLKKLRRLAGISQWKLARLTGYTQASISAFELGVRRPNADTNERIRKLLLPLIEKRAEELASVGA
jgi:transcriptional regulator with XRE-family HTH domain